MSQKDKLHEELTKLHQLLRADIQSKWQRSLPFADELFDRWERAKFLEFGKKTSIYNSSIVIGDVAVGENTWIGPYTFLDGSGGLSIGSNCSISTGVQIYSHDSVKWALSGGKTEYEKSSTKIGDCCYIGPNTVITMGINIGECCVIATNSFVNQDVPSLSIVGGTPAKIIGKVKIDSTTGKIELTYHKTN